jgi:SpoVK/Ycf46/Vps4 family AAA+-type ATPase
VERALKLRQYRNQPFTAADLIALKRRNIESECRGLIEFVESQNTLDSIHGLEPVKKWLRQDIALWRTSDIDAIPKGYLLCGPVGTGKSYLVECLAGEAGVPVVKLKNFRDRWVGSTEGNLEYIFRLVRALGRCYVFIDEADQSLGRRDTGNDSGVSGRIYSMLAEEMGSSRTRGRVIWILASSRPDLIEVDFKRPGRVDVKIPLLPAANAPESYELIRFACELKSLQLPSSCSPMLSGKLPALLTPGAAENIAVKTYRIVKTKSVNVEEALGQALEGYQPPIPEAVIRRQMDLAIAESSDPSFIPVEFR